MKVAFFGGSFNPFHLGHKKVVDHLIKNFDKVLIAPVQNYKKPAEFLKLEERIYCIKKIYLNNSKVEVLDWNIYNKKYTFALNFLKKIKSENPHFDLHLVVGSDYGNIDDWKGSDEIKSISKIYKVSRDLGDGVSINSPSVSSTELRVSPSKDLLPKEVWDYLYSNKKILVLDLDYNLFYPTDNIKDNSNLPTIPPFEDVRFFLRPHLAEFLDYASKNYILACWSSSGSEYVRHVSNHLFKDYPLLFSWSSSKCSPIVTSSISHKEIKKLSKVSKYFKKKIGEIITIDDTPTKCRENYGNFFYSKKFDGDPSDTDLLRLSEILKKIKGTKDITKFKKESLGDLWSKSSSYYSKKKKPWDDDLF